MDQLSSLTRSPTTSGDTPPTFAQSEPTTIRRIGLLGNHLPRHCGIATFTTHLGDAISTVFPDIDCFVVAMNDTGGRYAYPESVRFEIAEPDVQSYRRAADYLNVNTVDVVCLQHEFGIFGGTTGTHVLPLLRALRMPIVTTLHTILRSPSPAQRAVVSEIASLSERVVVMSQHAAELLEGIYGTAPNKIALVPHGIPSVPFDCDNKDRLGVEGKSVILTFGLLSPDKGIEQVIDALPAVIERHPDTVYVVLGATHPHVKARHGEAYRLMLEERARTLGVDSHLIFHNRFVSQEELTEFLAAADIYVTPYQQPEQIVSGTLAYAVGAGRAVISTPYAYAQELLADGRGILVPWKDPAAIAREIIGLLDDDDRRMTLRRRAALLGRAMVWPEVARRYVECFAQAHSEHGHRRRMSFQAKTLAEQPVSLPSVDLRHVHMMTDQTGMLQHAAFDVPRYDQGYCLDDNARALLLMTLVGEDDVDGVSARILATRYLAFVNHAFNRQTDRFRNFMSYDRQWVENLGSEDSHGRAVWALGAVVGRSSDPGRRSLGGDLFQAALRAIPTFTSPRAWAFALLGLDEYLKAFQGDSNARQVCSLLAARLLELFKRTGTRDWPWFEDELSYCNPRLSQALLVAGSQLGDLEMATAGLDSLEWLARLQRSADGYFAPVGSNGFGTRHTAIATFDQQPVEAGAMVSACLESLRITEDHRWAERAQIAFRWFLGHNHLEQSIYDPATGGCRDGLHVDRVNQNQGAESTLSFLLALVQMRAADPVQLAFEGGRRV